MTFVVERPSGLAATIQTYSAPATLAPGPYRLSLQFYTAAGGTGTKVGNATVSLRVDSSGELTNEAGLILGNIALEGRIEQVSVFPNQTILLGDTADLSISATAGGTVFAVDPATVSIQVTGGPGLTVNANGSVTATTQGEATVVATVDGVASAPQTISIDGQPIAPRGIVLNTKWLRYDPARGKVWASLGTYLRGGDSIAPIDPVTGATGDSLVVGASPGPIAISDDGSTLFVGLDASGTIRVVDLNTNTAEAEFAVTQPVSGSYRASDIAVAPGSTSTIAITTDFEFSEGSGPEIYDNGVPRPERLGLYEGRRLFWTSDSRIVAYNPASTGQTLFDVAVDSTGATRIRAASDSFLNPVGQAVRSGGRVYGSDGSIIDENTLERTGTVTPPPPLAVYDSRNIGPVIDVARNRIYIVTISPYASQLNAYRLDTLQRTSRRSLLNVEGLGANRAAQNPLLVPAGDDRIAFRTAERVYFIDHVSSL